MKTIKKSFVLILLSCFTLSVSAQDARTILNKMFAATDAGKRESFTMKQTERIDGKYFVTSSECKIQYSPRKIYMKVTGGENEGKELLYVKGERNDKILVNVLLGIKLSPFNNQIRKNQHNTLTALGFKLPTKILRQAVKRADAQNGFDKAFSLEGKVTYKGRSCYKLVITDPTFTYTSYTLKSGETSYSVAQKNLVSEYLIVEKSGLKNFNSAGEGTTIKLPSSYAKKSIFYIDAQTYYPVYQEMHDENGMFEKYEYSNLKINPIFTSNDFSEDNPNYNF